MLLTITCTAPQATDLGYLLHKNPGTLYEHPLTFGTVRAFYPQADDDRTTIALQVEVDPIGLVRGRHEHRTLAQYVSDRAYAPSSFLSVGIAEAFGTAMNGVSKERANRVAEPMPLTATLTALSCDAGAGLIHGVFEPLGYTVNVSVDSLLDDRFPQWGAGSIFDVTLTGTQTVQSLLTHLYVLIPVLDNAKHYAIGDDEVEKLLSRGAAWLPNHLLRETITRRYLRYRHKLTSDALTRLAEIEGNLDDNDGSDDAEISPAAAREEALEASPKPTVRLHDQRIASAVAAVRSLDPPARRVIDLGCGDGQGLLALTKALPHLEMVTGMDISSVSLARAARRLHLDRMSERQRERITLFVGSLVYHDARLAGYDAAILTEVLEHIELSRLPSVERVVWERAHPRRIIVTTPNRDYNPLYPTLPAGTFRHPDHRWEWSRAEFAEWAQRVASRYGYTVALSGIGEADAARGAASQMAVFDRVAADTAGLGTTADDNN